MGFYLDTLEEELLSIASSLQSKPAAEQTQSENSLGDAGEDGPWLEVGRRNRTAVTRTVRSHPFSSSRSPTIGSRLKWRNRLSRVYLEVNSGPPCVSLIKKNLSYSRIGGRYAWISRFEAVPIPHNVTG